MLLVPGPDNSPDNRSVLAPPELLAQLEKMASSDSWILHSAILVSARYEGQLVDNAARFQADLRVHCFQDNATLELPLEDVLLEKDAVVDGIKTNIVSLRPAAGYALKLAAGTHRVALQFSVPVHTMGEANELRFAVPRVTQNQLVLNLPAGASSVQTLVRQGQQQVTSDAGGVHLEADLGSINGPLHVRWLQEGKQPVKPIVKVREAYLWHLRPDGSRLEAAVLYSISRGAVSSLTFDLPDSLEVQNVETGPATDNSPARLKDWHVVTTGGRHVDVELQGLVTGEVRVLMTLTAGERASGFNPEARSPLPLPVPRNVESTERYLAYRLDGLKGEASSLQSVTNVKPDEFVKLYNAVSTRKYPPKDPHPTYACAFRREGGGNTAPLRLQIQLPEAVEHAVQDISWRVGVQQADLRATAQLTAPNGDLALVEWQIPQAVHLSSLTGRGVRDWTRPAGSNVVQIWLDRSVANTELQLTGWLPLERPVVPRSADRVRMTPLVTPAAGASNPGRFSLPCLRFVSVGQQTTYVQVIAGSGLAVTPQTVQHLLPLPDSRVSDQELAFVTRQSNYQGTIQVTHATATADIRVFTRAEVRDRQWTFISLVECRPRQNDVSAYRLTVRLQNWEGSQVRLEAPTATGRQERRSLSFPRSAPLVPTQSVGTREWDLELQRGQTGSHWVTLAGSMNVADNAGSLSHARRDCSRGNVRGALAGGRRC